MFLTFIDVSKDNALSFSCFGKLIISPYCIIKMMTLCHMVFFFSYGERRKTHAKKSVIRDGKVSSYFFFFFFFCLKPMMTMVCDVSFFATGGNSSIVSGLLFENLPPRLFPSRPSAHRLSIYLRQIESSRT